MLTDDLLRVRRTPKGLAPSYLRGAARARMLPIAEGLVATVRAMQGRPRHEVDAALSAVPVAARDRLVARGLRKLLDDRCEWEVAAGLDPEVVRAEVFALSAAAHRALGVRDRFDRAAVLAEAASRLGSTPDEVEAALFADLREAEVLRRFDPIAPEALLARYDLALAQGVLLRATRVMVRLEGETPARYRAVFRAIRFHGLLHVVRGDPSSGWVIELDGPYSLFESVQKYGLRLAMFLPSLLACERFHLTAEVLWGKRRDRTTFTLTPDDGLVGRGFEAAGTQPDLEAFQAAFRRLESEWRVATNDRIFALPGEVACIPDLVFESAETGEQVYLEAFGFWSRSAVWQRVELLRKGFPARVILAVGKQLRVSEEVLGEGDAGEIYVYSTTMSPRAVLERLRR